MNRPGATTVEALEERRVLAVDREQKPLPLAPGRECEITGGDEALLVRERERDAVLERPESRPDAREADDGIEDEVGRGTIEKLGDISADLCVLDPELRRELVEQPRARRQRADGQVRVGSDHFERLPADRAGRTDDGDSSRGHRRRLTGGVFSHGYAFPNARIVKYAAGPAQSRESRRSSAPP
jgi:hypothetical protein